MTKLILKELKNRIFLIIGSYLVFEIAFTFFFKNSYSKMEINFLLFALIACSFIFGSEDEIEFLITCKMSLGKILIARFIATYLAVTVLPAIRMLIYIESMKPINTIIVFMITTLFISALGTFWRVLMKTPFSAVIFSSLCFTILIFPNLKIFNSQWFQYISPFYAFMIMDEKIYIINRSFIILFSVGLIMLCWSILHKRETV